MSESGLVVSLQHPFLAATPDGFTGHKVIEIKCPYTGREEPITPSAHFPFLDINKMLKKDHVYYAQVQGQMWVCGKKMCDFVVYTFKDMLVIPVRFDEVYVNETLLPALTEFYHNTMLPYIAKQL